MTLRRDKRGATALEFALIGSALMMLSFGILEAGLLYWTRNSLASIAAATARCRSIGYDYATGSCQSDDNAKSFAVAAASQLPNPISVANVTVQTTASGCASVGSFVSISITHPAFSTFPPPFNAIALSVSACYPR